MSRPLAHGGVDTFFFIRIGIHTRCIKARLLQLMGLCKATGSATPIEGSCFMGLAYFLTLFLAIHLCDSFEDSKLSDAFRIPV